MASCPNWGLSKRAWHHASTREFSKSAWYHAPTREYSKSAWYPSPTREFSKSAWYLALTREFSKSAWYHAPTREFSFLKCDTYRLNGDGRSAGAVEMKIIPLPHRFRCKTHSKLYLAPLNRNI